MALDKVVIVSHGDEMKKIFSGLGSKVSLMVAATLAAVASPFQPKSFNAPESQPLHRSGKSSGGKQKRVERDPVRKAWYKVFGGLAVPRFGIELSPSISLKCHWSSAKGPRPYSFYKTSRV